jgi:uncharacterized protein
MPARAGKGADEPLRRLCIVTRLELPTDDLIRFGLAPDLTIVPDLARRLPGRGVWVTASHAAVGSAVASNAFSKSLKQKVNAPRDLADQVGRLMKARAREALSLANKAGAVIVGFAKVDAAITAAQVIMLVHASDASADGASKLDRKYSAVATARGQPTRVVNDFDGPELDLAIGRTNVVHAALIGSGAGRKFLSEARRYQRYRLNEDPGNEAALAPRIGASTDTE